MASQQFASAEGAYPPPYVDYPDDPNVFLPSPREEWRESGEQLIPLNDVGGPVERVNAAHDLNHDVPRVADPIRYGEFDPKRTQFRGAFTINPNFMAPRIRELFGDGKVGMEAHASRPRGSHGASWDWDRERTNVRRPPSTSFGTLSEVEG